MPGLPTDRLLHLRSIALNCKSKREQFQLGTSCSGWKVETLTSCQPTANGGAGKKKTIEIPQFQFIWGPGSPISLRPRLSSHCFQPSLRSPGQWLKWPPHHHLLRCQYFNLFYTNCQFTIYSSKILFSHSHPSPTPCGDAQSFHVGKILSRKHLVDGKGYLRRFNNSNIKLAYNVFQLKHGPLEFLEESNLMIACS